MPAHGRLWPWLVLLVLSAGCEVARGLVRGTTRSVNTYDDPTRGVVPWEAERYEATRSELDRPRPVR